MLVVDAVDDDPVVPLPVRDRRQRQVVEPALRRPDRARREAELLGAARDPGQRRPVGRGVDGLADVGDADRRGRSGGRSSPGRRRRSPSRRAGRRAGTGGSGAASAPRRRRPAPPPPAPARARPARARRAAASPPPAGSPRRNRAGRWRRGGSRTAGCAAPAGAGSRDARRAGGGRARAGSAAACTPRRPARSRRAARSETATARRRSRPCAGRRGGSRRRPRSCRRARAPARSRTSARVDRPRARSISPAGTSTRSSSETRSARASFESCAKLECTRKKFHSDRPVASAWNASRTCGCERVSAVKTDLPSRSACTAPLARTVATRTVSASRAISPKLSPRRSTLSGTSSPWSPCLTTRAEPAAST